jgi:hypothetical protein
MLCFWPVEIGAVVIIGAEVVDTDAWGDTVGTVVATGVFDSFPVHPAANASINTATRLKVMSKYGLLFAFMVFIK